MDIETHAVEVEQIAKAFGPTQAVADVSFTVEPGEILGLLGPNGAGKTTTIRLILDILAPDRGRVVVLGGPMTEAKKDRIGYMPEERGLYQDVTLERGLRYLAALKNVPPAEARRRLDSLLARFDLAAHRDKPVKALSKGMQQKAQIITTILHQPALIIVDEPFAALDPVNTRLVKDLLAELRAGGAAILMSTHQMHHVEALCDRILLIDHGRALLYGTLQEIRRAHTGHAVTVQVTGALPPLPGVEAAREGASGAHRLSLADGTTPQDVLAALVAGGTIVERFEVATPALDEIFVQVVGRGGEAGAS